MFMLWLSQLGENKYPEGYIVTCMILNFLNLSLAKGFLGCLLVNIYKQSYFQFKWKMYADCIYALNPYIGLLNYRNLNGDCVIKLFFMMCFGINLGKTFV